MSFEEDSPAYTAYYDNERQAVVVSVAHKDEALSEKVRALRQAIQSPDYRWDGPLVTYTYDSQGNRLP